MTFAVVVEQLADSFAARLVGEPEISANGPTRAAAIQNLQKEVGARLASGDLTLIDVPPAGIHALAGIWKDDPSVGELVSEIYAQRDTETVE